MIMELAVIICTAATDGGVTTIAAADSGVDWSGRIMRTDQSSVRFDWLGVTARVKVSGASYVSMNVSTTTNRGTRMRVYASDQGFDLYPQTQFWVNKDPRFANKLLYAANGKESTMITISNIVAPQYGTGITEAFSFETDGKFEPVPQQTRRMEFVGDSITAATNVVRPEGAPHCGDGGYQSDWSQTYSALLCQHFDASCSTIAVGGKCIMKVAYHCNNIDSHC